MLSAITAATSGIDRIRLQRVPDVMLQFGLLHARFDIIQMLGS